MEELDAIKNEIDIFAERFLMRASKSKTKSEAQIEKAHDKINSNRRQMIKEVEVFAKKLLANMSTNELEAELAKKVKLSIEELDKKLQWLEKKLESKSNKSVRTEKVISELEHAIDVAIYEFDCSIKQKSSLLFINVFLLKKSLNSNFKCIKAANEARFAEYLGRNLPEPKMECDEIYHDEDEVEYDVPNLYFQLDASTTFGVLFHLDECVRKEEFV